MKSLDDASSLIDLAVFPNPAQDELNLQWDSSVSGNYDIYVLDMNGRTVLADQQAVKEGANILRIETRDLENGTYLIQLVHESQIAVKRFLIRTQECSARP